MNVVRHRRGPSRSSRSAAGRCARITSSRLTRAMFPGLSQVVSPRTSTGSRQWMWPFTTRSTPGIDLGITYRGISGPEKTTSWWVIQTTVDSRSGAGV